MNASIVIKQADINTFNIDATFRLESEAERQAGLPEEISDKASAKASYSGDTFNSGRSGRRR
jgi:hypothetical protein